MVKQITKAEPQSARKKREEPLNSIYLALLIGYGFIAVLTPNLQTADSNGPKFLALALFNLVTFLYLFSNKNFNSKKESYFAFFSNGVGILYSGLMVVSILSFVKSINILESILHFSKIFTTFSAAYLISILIAYDRRYITYLSVAMTFLLAFDSVSVFSGIIKFINGYTSISDIMSVYSNKNILTASIFVKLPFAIWLMIFSQKWKRFAGICVTFLAFTATFFLNARAFYLGSISLLCIVSIILIIRYLQSMNKYFLKISGLFLIIILLSYFIFSITQRFLYKNTSDQYAQSFETRMASINNSDGGGGRLMAWNWSWQLFRQSPLLGVGLGNWKVEILRLENQTSPDYIYALKAHNDFVEISTETGAFGGLFFIGLFLLAGFTFIIVLFKNGSSEYLTYLFLPVTGLFCYSFDAFFNFPQDRPEIQALFALYVGSVIAVSHQFSSKKEQSVSVKKWIGWTEHFSFINQINTFFTSNPSNDKRATESNNPRLAIRILFGFVLMACVYILYLYFISLQLQHIIWGDIKRVQKADTFVNKYPFIPTLGPTSEPVVDQKAIYLLHENRNEEALKLLKPDHSSPFDSRREYYIAEAYKNLKIADSSIVYLKKVYYLKPYFFNNIANLMNFYRMKGSDKENEFLLSNYLMTVKSNKDAWLFTASYYDKGGNMQKALSVIDSAAYYFPLDSLVLKQKQTIHRRALIVPYEALYDSAANFFNSGKYKEAVEIYNEILSKKPDLTELLHFRAYSYYHLKEYGKSNQDLNYLISSGASSSGIFNLYSLRGANYYMLGNMDEACKNYKIASDMGDKDGQVNFTRFCKQ